LPGAIVWHCHRTRERGSRTFARGDFGDRKTDTALQKGAAPEIVVKFV
jgi:hypothetical protein